MVNFSQDFVVRMKERMTKFSNADRIGNVKSKMTVNIVKGNNLESTANVIGQNFSWKSGEEGPSPLAYFLSSLGMCQMIHYAEWAASGNVELDILEIRVEGEFFVSRPRSFSRISYSVRIDSNQDPETIIALATNASSDCYVTNTLSKACEVSGQLIVNGKDFGKIGSK
jgi:uncharacterized OsmC-like protein